MLSHSILDKEVFLISSIWTENNYRKNPMKSNPKIYAVMTIKFEQGGFTID